MLSTTAVKDKEFQLLEEEKSTLKNMGISIVALINVYNDEIAEAFSHLEEKIISLKSEGGLEEEKLKILGEKLELLSDILSQLENSYDAVTSSELVLFYKEKHDELLCQFNDFNKKTSEKICANEVAVENLKEKLAKTEKLASKNQSMWSPLLESITSLRGSKAEKPIEDISKRFDEYDAEKNLSEARLRLMEAKKNLSEARLRLMEAKKNLSKAHLRRIAAENNLLRLENEYLKKMRDIERFNKDILTFEEERTFEENKKRAEYEIKEISEQEIKRAEEDIQYCKARVCLCEHKYHKIKQECQKIMPTRQIAEKQKKMTVFL